MKIWNRNTIDLKEYLEKDIAIHCDTEEKSDDLLECLDEKGIKWASGSRLTEKNYYCCYEELTCYNYHKFGEISCSDTKMYERNRYDIVEWEIVDKKQQKNNISWDKFVNENIAIHCKSEKETEELLCWILQNKKEMSVSPIIAFANGWKEYRGDICFEFGSNKVNLQPSTYSLPVKMMKATNITSPSMASSCIKNATIDIGNDSKPTVTIDLQAVSIMGISDWAESWQIYKGNSANGETFTANTRTNEENEVDL